MSLCMYVYEESRYYYQWARKVALVVVLTVVDENRFTWKYSPSARYWPP